MNRETLDKLNAKLGSKEEEVKNYTQPEKGGVALVNVNNRIHLIFGEEYGMHVYSLENMGTSVELSIPVIYNENELKKKETVMKKEVLRLQDVTYKKENTFIFRNMTFSIMEVRLWESHP